MPKNHQITFSLLSYEVNRPLSDDERRYHLPQGKPSLSRPIHLLSVIKMNSTFLECVDRVYGSRGAMAGCAIVLGPLLFGITGEILGDIFGVFYAGAGKQRGDILLLLFETLFVLLMIIGYIIALKADCFRHTHYPLRFNRRTRMVHVFRNDGSVLSVPWDKVYFTLGYLAADFWEVLGHVLSDDGNTVLDTFPLSIRHIWDNSPGTTMYSQWEFIRRYMEEGPEKLCGQVDLVMPIDEQRESYLHGFKRLFANYLPWPVAMVILSPVLFIGTIGRWIAMQTSKIPRWPAEVEAESQIDPNDPYIRDEHHLA